uniref:Uncharacterized protein n=1 Tax=Triticum urartu TaxID=4572 RepID=A0A8R7QCC5_TRIUA
MLPIFFSILHPPIQSYPSPSPSSAATTGNLGAPLPNHRCHRSHPLPHPPLSPSVLKIGGPQNKQAEALPDLRWLLPDPPSNARGRLLPRVVLRQSWPPLPFQRSPWR